MGISYSPVAGVVGALRELGVELPLTPSGEDIGVVLDARGRVIFTIDVNNERPDREVTAIAELLAAAANAAAASTLAGGDR